ncbi:MAG: glycosyl transferase [Sphingobium sp.]
MGKPMFQECSDTQSLPSSLQKICFFFNAQIHHLFHALPLALELSRDPNFHVDIVSPSEGHLALAREIAAHHRAGDIRFIRTGGAGLSALTWLSRSSTPPKLPSLIAACSTLRNYDAIVVAERTSLLLRHLGLRNSCFIHTCHGAGDRAVGYDPRIRNFDFVLLAGDKQRRRMLDKGLIREGHYAIVGYSKFELASAQDSDGLFPERRPVVLYNPHFSKRLSSWDSMGIDIIEQFAADDRFNLIVAPHIRLFDNRAQRAAMERRLTEFSRLPHIHIDLGSLACVDMRYVEAASLYIGDVSSQVYEYIRRPRPCLFLNAHGASWQDNADYRHWHYGPVLENCEYIINKAALAIASHDRYAHAQYEGIADTFGELEDRPSANAARVVRTFLTRRQLVHAIADRGGAIPEQGAFAHE